MKTQRPRPCEEKDMQAVKALMAQLGYAQSEATLAKNINTIRAGGGEVFVAEQSGGVCGCVSVRIDVRLAGGVSAEIASLVVDETVRGGGVGGQLLAAAEAWARRHTQRIHVRTNVVRRRAHAFYQNRGYSLVKRQAVYDKTL